MISKYLKKNEGFTLVEILIVVAIMGMIIGALYSVYLTHQKSAYSQEEVVEVQQNLRIAMENITRDIRMAGMLVPTSTQAVAAGFTNYSTSINLNTASAKGIYARIDAAPTITEGTDSVTVTIESPEAYDVIKANSGADVIARIIRPFDRIRPFETSFTVTAASRETPSLTLKRLKDNFNSADVIKKGDIIALTENGAPDPNTIAYSVVNGGTVVNGVTCPQKQRCIVRSANDSDEIIANNISSLKYAYILDDYTEEKTPADLEKVRAVRVTITGQTAETALLSGGSKTRQLTSIVKIHNRR